MQDQRLRELVEPILASAGLELDGLDVTPVGKRRLVRVTVDGDGPAGRGPTLDDISDASREISEALDASSVMGEAPFTLEVSSRGVGKPLTDVRHYRRNVGRLVSVELSDGKFAGRIKGVDGDVVTLEVDGETRGVALAEVTKAVIQVEMNPPKELLDEPGTDLED